MARCYAHLSSPGSLFAVFSLPPRLAFFLTGLLAATVLAGCAHRRPALNERVAGVHFEGNSSFWDGTGDFHVRQAMEQERGAWSTFLFPRLAVPLDRTTLLQDAWRIELWYAHHGYFDARFLGWDIREKKRARGRKPAVLELTGRVDEGEASVFREVTFTGLDLGGGTVHRRYIERHAAVLAGERFSLEAVEDTEALIRSWLREHAYAWVQVEVHVDAYPEEHLVDVRFDVYPGVPCKFGEVDVSGSDNVPRPMILDEVEVLPGRSFKASLLSETRRNLFGLGTFSTVSVLPRHQPEQEAVVPVDIRLTESRFRRIRLGGGVGVESGQQDAHLSVGYQHKNLFSRLIQLDLETEGGVAAIATYDDIVGGEVQKWAPVIDSGLDLTFPRIFGKGWKMVQALDFEMGLESDFTFYQPSWEPAVSWTTEPRKGTRRELGTVTFTTAYRLSYFDFIEQDLDLSNIESSRLGLDLTAPYMLSYAEESLVWDLRDDPLFTTRGLYLSGSLGMAGGFGERGAPLFGNFDFVKVETDLRMFNSLAPLFDMESDFVLATRLAGGIAQPWGDGGRASVPYAERFKIGGGNSVRGWVTDHLGPRLCERLDENGDRVLPTTEDGEWGGADSAYQLIDADNPNCPDIIPVGGQVYTVGSVELRKEIVERWGLGVAGFLDVGMAWADLASVSQQWPLPSAGGGIRYKSPFGPVRLDLGIRLYDDPDFEGEERRWNIHFSLSEAF